MKWLPYGDCALIAYSQKATRESQLTEVSRTARLLRSLQIEGLIDVVSSYHCVVAYFDPLHAGKIREALNSVLLSSEPSPSPPQSHLIEIHYDQEALATLSKTLDLSVEEIIALHSSARYHVAALGFSPGFPYLTGLPHELHVPRKHQPEQVSAGTVAIAADQTGIYSNASLGGWHPLGHTDFPLFDASKTPPCRLETGDQVTFCPVAPSSPKAPPQTTPPAIKNPCLQILSEAPCTTLQDSGRPGLRHYGITAGGFADWEMAASANLLVGNPPEKTALEFSLQGNELTFLTEALVAFTGFQHKDAGKPLRVHPGQRLDLRGRMNSSFAYLAINGGFKSTNVLSSHSTDVRGRFGGHEGRPLKAGDLLEAQEESTSPALTHHQSVAWPLPGRRPKTLLVRILPGLHHELFSEASQEALFTDVFTKTAEFDRTGARLQGPKLHLQQPGELSSVPIVPGSIQVPPNGQPIILLPEAQTLGGYPMIAHIITADLPAFARALPGTPIRFHPVNTEQAQEAYWLRKQEASFLSTGLQLLTKAT